MAELKRLFNQGRMNKDLDERLVPNGEYRDALNIQVDTSESGEVGTVQNVLGNTLLNNASVDDSTGVFTAHTTNLGLILPTCIGSIRHDPTECIYWFIVDSNGGYIAEYNATANLVKPVLVDRNSVLDFSTSYLITGINIIDGILFWTDNNGEPKRINIDRFRDSSVNFTTHTQIAFQSGQTARDFILHDVTVIKAGPKESPTLVMTDTKRSGIIETTISFTDTNLGTFTQELDDVLSLIGPMDPGTSVTLNFLSQPNYQVGDTLIITLITDDDDEEGTIVRVRVNEVITTTQMEVTIQSIDSEVKTIHLDWTVELEQEAAIFEFKFPRFSTRWKYIDGEYSTFGPFTKVAFLPVDQNEFEYNCKQGYNLGMINSIKSNTKTL